MPKILVTLTVLFLTLSAVFGVLNTTKARSLREIAARSDSARAAAEQARMAKEKESRQRETDSAAKDARTDAKIASAEADLVKSQSERADLHAQLQADQQQIADLQRRLDEAAPKDLMPDALPMPGGGDLQAQLEDTRKQLDSAEREKQLLSGKIRGAQDQRGGVEAPRKRVAAAVRAVIINPKLRGTVLAVNQAYNFVVLNLGGRQGVEANSEMLVLRGGTLIGKIRVSSVEPATAIADIVGSSLAPGVQVQPGDSVIYAGTSS
ncbi:MAG: hypothetical protein H0X73_01830 [Chthoniobacterales bacterium]|nr:hypothetical protein [Chthoniobacterales bacterium]